MAAALRLIWFLFKCLKLEAQKVISFFVVDGRTSFCLLSRRLKGGATFGSSERPLHLGSCSLWRSRTSRTNLSPVLHILLLFYSFYEMASKPTWCNSTDCVVDLRDHVWVPSEDVSSVIRISKYPGNTSYGILISLFRCFMPFFRFPAVIFWVIVLWRWCIAWPKCKKHQS